MMKFSLFVHMERTFVETSQKQLYQEMITLCKIADEGGLHTVWTGEHHGMNFTVAPNPLINLVDIAHQTNQVRLGTGTLIAPFWHPIKAAGEIAMADIITDGRLEIGIARGAYSYEYERLMPGLDAWEAGCRMREFVPAVKKLWVGDYEHCGKYWQFPKTTSSPRPIQQPSPPIWIAARDPNSHEFAVEQGCNVQVTPLHAGDEEVQNLMNHFNAACQKFTQVPRPKIMVLRHTYVAKDEEDSRLGAEEINRFYNYFGAWFKNERTVSQGFIKPLTEKEIADNTFINAKKMRENQIIGQADEVIKRIKSYEAMGYDEFSFWIDSGMSFERKKASLERFIKDVIPAFEGKEEK